MKWVGILMLSAMSLGVHSQDDIVARLEKAESERRTCRANLMTYANAAMAHRVRTRQGFTSNLSELHEYTSAPLVCPGGGSYSILADVPTGSFTLHCTILSHDAGHIQPAGFSPRLNTDSDIFSRINDMDSSQPPRSRCRARMAMISDAQVNFMLDNGRFTSNPDEFFYLTLKCPGGGTYSVVIGKPTHAFTVHCSLPEHDAGMVEPRGYSPGRNSQ